MFSFSVRFFENIGGLCRLFQIGAFSVLFSEKDSRRADMTAHFEDLDVEEFEIVATLDKTTCEVCGELD